MHFTIPPSAFRELLSLLKAVIPSKTSLPILRCALFTVSPDGLTLTVRATDLDLFLSIEIALAGPGLPGTAAIPLKSLSALRPDKGQPLTFDTTRVTGTTVARYTLSGTAVTTTLDVEDPTNFPPAPPPPAATDPFTQLPAETLQAIATSLAFQSADETRYVLNGAYLDPEEGGHVIATDGRRLIAVKTRVTPVPIILPSKACTFIARFKEADCKAAIALGQDFRPVTFQLGTAGRITLHTRTIEGNFPHWRQVMPQQPATEISRLTFGDPAAAARFLRSLVEPAKGQHSITLKPVAGNPSRVALEHRSAVATFPALIEGPVPAIAFNPTFLAAALESVPGTLQLTDEMSPALILSSHGRAVLMPMRRHD